MCRCNTIETFKNLFCGRSSILKYGPVVETNKFNMLRRWLAMSEYMTIIALDFEFTYLMITVYSKCSF